MLSFKPLTVASDKVWATWLENLEPTCMNKNNEKSLPNKLINESDILKLLSKSVLIIIFDENDLDSALENEETGS